MYSTESKLSQYAGGYSNEGIKLNTDNLVYRPDDKIEEMNLEEYLREYSVLLYNEVNNKDSILSFEKYRINWK